MVNDLGAWLGALASSSEKIENNNNNMRIENYDHSNQSGFCHMITTLNSSSVSLLHVAIF
jgi:hypothetical protein